jgi:hypothetical protein
MAMTDTNNSDPSQFDFDKEAEIEQHRYKLLLKNYLAGSDFDIDKLIREVLPLVDAIYNEVRAVAKWHRRSKWRERKERAIAYFHKNKWDLPLIKAEMLEDENLYKLRKGKERLDFRVKLISKLITEVLHRPPYPIRSLRKKLQGLK